MLKTLLLTGCILLLGACQSDTTQQTSQSSQSSQSQVSVSSSREESSSQAESRSRREVSSSSETTGGAPEAVIKSLDDGSSRVGAETYGYLTLPSKWGEFHTVGGDSSVVQFSSLSDNYVIVTLSRYKVSDIAASPEEARQFVYDQLTQYINSSTGTEIEEIPFTVGGYEAQAFTTLAAEDYRFTVAVFYNEAADYIYYVAFEGDDATVTEQAANYAATWSLTE